MVGTHELGASQAFQKAANTSCNDLNALCTSPGQRARGWWRNSQTGVWTVGTAGYQFVNTNCESWAVLLTGVLDGGWLRGQAESWDTSVRYMH